MKNVFTGLTSTIKDKINYDQTEEIGKTINQKLDGIAVIASFFGFSGKEFDSLETLRFNQDMEISAKSKSAIKPQQRLPPTEGAIFLTFPSCLSSINRVGNVDWYQFRSIRMRMESIPEFIYTNTDRPRTFTQG